MKIGIVGCGNLGFSILTGIYNKEFVEQVIVSKRNIESLKTLSMENVEVTSDNAHLISNSSLIIIALKPYNVVQFLEEFKGCFDPVHHTIVSVATGVTITEMQAVIGEGYDIFRAMPNTAATVNESITSIAFKRDTLGRKLAVEKLFNSLGDTIFIDEKLMESATILGACGIAYVLRFMRAMIQGGIEVGFDSATATKIVAQTIKGASELIIQNGTHPEEEIDKVTTPKGCTIVGLNEMEHSGFSSALIKGIVTSYQKIEK